MNLSEPLELRCLRTSILADYILRDEQLIACENPCITLCY